ncbi:MAG: UDP-N-acetylmuramate dehydrogenase [Clostridia bacterium]|nr:UDP-N-acetylmuramate dehydrogenase [Clostridia bacterium]
MKLEQFICELSNEKIEYSENEAMCRHTTFGIGGNADVFVMPENPLQLARVLCLAKKCDVPYLVIGNGSNLLVSDKGIEGAVIKVGDWNDISHNSETVTCSAGVKLANLCKYCEEQSLQGLEFGYGIPGTVGGALYMNAGAYGGEIKDVVESAECITDSGEIVTVSAEDMSLGYRTSVFKKNKNIITSVTFRLAKGNKTEIRAKMDDFMTRRVTKQPLDAKSAGSTFKRPAGNFAGTLIESCGLKGFSIGGAKVSEKHAGFVINKGNATCSDVLRLISHIEQTVSLKTGYALEPEVIFVGRK